jgi:hypothetical protein
MPPPLAAAPISAVPAARADPGGGAERGRQGGDGRGVGGERRRVGGQGGALRHLLRRPENPLAVGVAEHVRDAFAGRGADPEQRPERRGGGLGGNAPEHANESRASNRLRACSAAPRQPCVPSISPIAAERKPVPISSNAWRNGWAKRSVSAAAPRRRDARWSSASCVE